MKRVLVFAGIAALVAIVGAMALGAVALAQNADEGDGWPFDFRERMSEAIAGILGINVEKYDAAVDQAQEQVLGEAIDEGWLTQDQADRMRERFEEGAGPGRMGGRFPGMGGGMMHLDGSLLDLAAEKLGLSVEELRTELEEGKSIAAVAEEQDVDPQIIVDAYVAQMRETLDEAVENGRITQKQADWALEQGETRIQEMLERTFDADDCGPGHFRRGGRPGRFPGFPGQDDASTQQDA